MAPPGRKSRGRKILLLTQLPPPYGGLTVHSERLRATLLARGFEVEVRTPPSGLPAGRQRFRRLRNLAQQGRFLAQLLLRRCDLVHDHVSTYPVGEQAGLAMVLHLAMLAALRFGTSPWVVTCGNGVLPSRLGSVAPWQRRLLAFLYGGAVLGIAKNEPIAQAFARLGLAGRTQVIGTFLEPLRPARDRPLPPEVEGFLAAHPVCIVSAGFRFEPLYHLEAVVRGVAELRRNAAAHGLPAGVGLVILASRAEVEEGKRAFDEAVAESAIGDDLLLLRDVDYTLELLERASAFVRATDYDGDANTVKEGMLMGVPVLATDLPGRPPGIALLPREALSGLGPRLAELLAKPDPAQLAENRRFVERDVAKNTEAILAAYARALEG